MTVDVDAPKPPEESPEAKARRQREERRVDQALFSERREQAEDETSLLFRLFGRNSLFDMIGGPIGGGGFGGGSGGSSPPPGGGGTAGGGGSLTGGSGGAGGSHFIQIK